MTVLGLRLLAHSGPPEQLEQCGLREFGCAAQAAVDRIHGAADLRRQLVELARPDDHLALGTRARGQPLHQRVAILRDLLRLLAE
jgi:hypothetical protein